MKRREPGAAPMPHRVRRLVWRARLAGGDDAPALRRLLHEQQETVEAVLDAELGAIDDGRVRRVRRLELTLAAASLQALADELPQRLGPSLRLAWASAQSGASAQADDLPTPSDTAADARDWLLHMLDSGRLPWPLAGLSPDHVRSRLQEAAELAAQGPFDPVFAQHAAAAPAPHERVAWVARFLALLLPATRTAWLDAASPWWAEVPAARLKAVLQWRRQALRAGLNAQRVDALSGSLLLLARSGPWPPAEDWSAWARTLGEPAAGAVMPSRRPWSGSQPPATAGSQGTAPHDHGLPAPRPRGPDEDSEAGLLLPLAGLVLLHPFLPRLLQGLGLAMPGTATRPLSVESLQRALPLLHALATGADEVQEFELGGAKLLLGLDPGRPLPFPLQPASTAEHAEADALLDAAIGHWPALRGTGREGLRTSFLQRRGLLRRGDGGPVLTLQSEPFDLLLNTLPWGLGLVKLPWMPEPLHVEWPDAAMTAPASPALAAELDWLAECLRLRLAQYFDRERSRSPALPEAGPPAPAWPTGCAYGSALAAHGIDTADRLLLALALAPLLRPPLLDVLHSRNDSTQRGFTEFGGLSTATSPAFVPTVETACFLLAGDDLDRRLQVLQRLSPAGTLARRDLLHVSASESPLVGALQPGAAFIAQALPALLPLLDHGSPLPAQRVHTGLDWDELVLPASTLAQLDDIGLWLAHGDTLLGEWGLSRRIAPGFTSLFHGPPGTGKTLSACLLGRRCGREVWRVDLSRLVSKYIGETEKNLGRLFDVAETRGWILFFDEADALFGKRTGVSDAHDRYANQEVSYLLQRVEAYAGVVILASNLRHHIDEAFLRRFQSVVPFALPRPPERLRLWREGFPAAVQLEHGVDLGRIAQQHELSGGTIMNVVRWCCLRAVGHGDTRIRAGDIDEGIRRELLKEGRTL